MNIKKIFGKAIISLLILSLGVANSSIFVYSLGSGVNDISNNIPQELIYEIDNVTYTFNNLEEKQQFVRMYNQEVSGVVTFSDVQTTSTVVSSQKYTNGWINYLTNAWSTHSSFQYATGTTYSATLNGTYSGVGFSVSASKTFSIGGTIVADSKRLSRLGMWQRHTVTKYKGVTTGGYGAYVINTFYYTGVSKSGTPIVDAAYQTAPQKGGVAYSK